MESTSAFPAAAAAAAATVFAIISHPEDRKLRECGELGEALTCPPAQSLSPALSVLLAEPLRELPPLAWESAAPGRTREPQAHRGGGGVCPGARC